MRVAPQARYRLRELTVSNVQHSLYDKLHNVATQIASAASSICLAARFALLVISLLTRHARKMTQEIRVHMH